MKRAIRIAGLVVLSAYLVSGVARAWRNPSGAHGTRQLDTSGMALALALDVKADGLGALATTALYPRVLQRGLAAGFNVAEFQLVSLLTWPFFYLGPHAGSLLATLLILAANAFAAGWALPRLLRRSGADLPWWLAALTYLSAGTAAFQCSIVMPEGLSFPLLVTGLAVIETGPLAACALLSLAMLVMPVAVVGLVAAPFFRLEKSNRWRMIAVLCASLLPPAWWYAIHAHAVQARVVGFQVFKTATFTPLQGFVDFGWDGVWKIFCRQLFSAGQFPIYTGALWVVLALARDRAWLGRLLLGILVIVGLVGPHTWIHAYYFFGVSAISLVLMGRELSRRQGMLSVVCLVCVFWGALYAIRDNVWVIARSEDSWALAAPLRAAIPPGLPVVTDDAEDPRKLFTLGVAGTMAGGAVCERKELRGRSFVAVVDASKAAARSCLKPGHLLARSETQDASWAAYRVDPSD